MNAEGVGFQQTVVSQIGAQGGGLFIPTSKCIYINLYPISDGKERIKFTS